MRIYVVRRLVAVTVAAMFALAACDDSPTEPPAQVPADVELTPDEVQLTHIGGSVALHATVLDAGGEQIVGANLNWSSSDEEVVTVNALGTVVAAGVGSATITATSGDAAGSAAITVEQVAHAVEISPAPVVLLAIGASRELSGVVLDEGDHPIGGLTVVSWASSDESVVTVDQDGVAEAVGVGEAVITAIHDDEVEGEVEVSVVLAAAIEVDPAEVTLTPGDTEELAAVVLDGDGEEIEDAEVTWSSSNEDVATVDASGEVEAVGEGTATITAQAGSATATVSVTVEVDDD
jgi:uncharacterized protein YjdB